MGKLLLSADVHIYAFSQYNLSTNFRLNQFIKLAHRFVEIGKQEECKRLAFLGDSIHKPILPPRVAHIASKFFDILSEWFDDIYFILGQHCTDSKSETFLQEDSLVPILSKNTSAIYADKKIINIDGRNIAFCNWQPHPDWSFIKGKNVDVFLGHLTLHSEYGQDHDNSDYTIGFFGDIHQRKSYGKDHTVNVPIPHYISDCQDGSVISLDLGDLSWKRIDTESKDFQYLKMYYEDELPKKYNKDFTVIVSKPKITDTVTKIYKSLDVNSLIREVTQKNKLEDIHSDVIANVKLDYIETNYNFKLNNIQISNFRSISSLEYDFIKSGITLITGKNGSGKSSLMRAINFVFLPPKIIKTLIKNGCKDMKVTLSFTYGENEYIVTRGYDKKSILEVSIDGVALQAASITSLNDKLIERLPFIKVFEIFYRCQGSPHVLDDYNYADRISLISNILNINIVEILYKQATVLLKESISKKKCLWSQKSMCETLCKSLYDSDFENCDAGEIDKLKLLNDEFIVEIADNKNKQAALKALEDLKSRALTIKSNIDAIKEQLADIDIDNFNSDELNKEHKLLTDRLRKYEDKIQSNTEIINRLKNKLLTSQNSRSFIEKQISDLEIAKKEVKLTCPLCSLTLPQSNYDKIISEYTEQIKSYKNKQEKMINDENRISADIDALLHSNEQGKLHLDKTISLIQDIKIKLAYQDKIESQLKKYGKLKAEYNEINSKIEVAVNGGTKLIDNDFMYYQNIIDIVSEKFNINNNKITKINSILANKEKYDNEKYKLDNILEELNVLSGYIDKLECYVSLFSNTGDIIKSVFVKISEVMSTDNIIVNTVKLLSNGETRIDFSISLKVGKVLIPYPELSGGQKTLIDIYFLCKLYAISGDVGLLMLDETLRDLDIDNVEFVINSLLNANINNILITSHLESFNEYNSRILVKLDGNDSRYIID